MQIYACCQSWPSVGHDRQHFREHCFYGCVAVERRFQDVSISVKILRRKNVSIILVLQTSMGGPTLCCRIHMPGNNKRWYPMTAMFFFCFVLFCAFCFGIGKGKQFTKKKNRFWPRPSVVVHSSCYPIGKSSGRCPKRRGAWTTPSQSLRSPTSRSDFDDDNPITGHASCLRWTSAVQCWQADLMVRHLWGFRWAFVSHECDRFFQHRFWQTRSESDRLGQTASKIDHASHTLFHVHNVDMYALGQLWIWCDWCELPRLKAATLVNISETSACIETVSLFLWHSFTWQTELSLCPVF